MKPEHSLLSGFEFDARTHEDGSRERLRQNRGVAPLDTCSYIYTWTFRPNAISTRSSRVLLYEAIIS